MEKMSDRCPLAGRTCVFRLVANAAIDCKARRRSYHPEFAFTGLRTATALAIRALDTWSDSVRKCYNGGRDQP